MGDFRLISREKYILQGNTWEKKYSALKKTIYLMACNRLEKKYYIVVCPEVWEKKILTQTKSPISRLKSEIFADPERILTKKKLNKQTKGNENWFEKSGDRKIEGDIETHLFLISNLEGGWTAPSVTDCKISFFRNSFKVRKNPISVGTRQTNRG